MMPSLHSETISYIIGAMKSQAKYPKTFSMEFFPPKTEKGVASLRSTIAELGQLRPSYFSATFGAGGSTQQGTLDTVFEIQKAGFDVAPHLSCIGTTKEGIRNILKKYMDKGINRIVALRGDIPSGMGGEAGDFNYANELVDFIRKETGAHFYIEVAAYPEFHPQASSASADLKNFKRKVEAGANAAITQYFYNVDAYLKFIDDCEKMQLKLPVVPGIMPITNYEQLIRFSDTCGAEIPRWIRMRLDDYGSDLKSLRAFGLDVTTDVCRRLIDAGAPGLHFFTMNQAEPTTLIWNALGLAGQA